MLAEQLADTLTVRAPAKVNLFLELLRKRADGYHDIVTCVVAIDLFDTLSFKEDRDGDLQLTCDDPALPVGPENLVLRAAELLRRHTGAKRGARIHLGKRIPMQAGLGGGSSDAAATLFGLNRLWRLGLSAAELANLGATLGSDVPFFFSTPAWATWATSAAWCSGRGEQVTPFPLVKPLHFVLVCPAVGLSTAEVYRGATVPKKPRAPDPLRRALVAGDVAALGAALFNRLQPAAERLCPEVAAVRKMFEELRPAGQLMSGSGSSSFALTRTRRDAQALARQVRQRLKSPGKVPGSRLFVVRSLTTTDPPATEH